MIGLPVFSQTSGRDPQYQIDYEMELKKPGSFIGISTFKSPSEQDKSNCKGLKGVRIRLTNGDNLIYDNVAVDCGPYAPNRANVKASILLTPELEAKLDGQEIVEFTLGNLKTPVTFKEDNENLKVLLKLVKDESGF
ncbi:hypothetical protein [Flavobacterium agri]|nr:hypothetical protein [Flavobacterium agri]